jgi:hypothetical protein
MTEPQPARSNTCESENQNTFPAEMIIHFPGIAGLDKPIVWVYPSISVCLNCGKAEFVVPEEQVELLRTGVAKGKKAPKSERRKSAPLHVRQRRARADYCVTTKPLWRSRDSARTATLPELRHCRALSSRNNSPERNRTYMGNAVLVLPRVRPAICVLWLASSKRTSQEE